MATASGGCPDARAEARVRVAVGWGHGERTGKVTAPQPKFRGLSTSPDSAVRPVHPEDGRVPSQQNLNSGLEKARLSSNVIASRTKLKH